MTDSSDQPRDTGGPSARIRDLETAHGTGVTPKRDLAIVAGEGAYLHDANGNTFIDMGASYGVCNAGHSHPAVVEAITRQARALMYVSPTYHNDARARLMGRLADLAPGDLDRVFLTNSGTESVEAAIKFARKHTDRPGIVAAKRSFHGRTMGALSITWNPKYRKGFEPLLPGTGFVPFGDLAALGEAVGPDTADIMTLAKSLAGGLPIGAMLARPHVCDLPPGSHGGTFAGSPVSCAAALATLDVIEGEDLPARAARLGDRALASLRELPGRTRAVRTIRGMGLMLGIELRERAAPYLTAAMHAGVLALPAGASVVRLLPPLMIPEEVLDGALDTLKGVLTDG